MLTTKIRGEILAAAALVLLMGFLAGCGEPGPNAVQKGDRLIREGKHAQAVEVLGEATLHLPNEARVWNLLGLAHHGNGDHDKAIQAYEKALQLDRDLAVTRYNLGSALFEQGKFAPAAEQFTTFTRLSPQSVEGWLKLGTSQMRHASQLSGAEKGRWIESARKNFENSLGIAKTAEAHNSLGLLEVQRNRPREALSHFTAAVQKQPDNSAALLNLAILYDVHFDDDAAALPRYRAFLEAHSSAPEAAAVAARLEQMGARPQATQGAAATRDAGGESGSRYKYLSPARPPAGNRDKATTAYNAGSQALKARDPAKALGHFRDAIQADPGFFEAHFALGLAAMELRDWKTALEAYEKALAIDRNSAPARHNFSLALQGAGYTHDAIAEVQKILQANPRDVRAHLTLASIHARDAQTVAVARQHYGKVLELEPRHPEAANIKKWLEANR